MVKGTIMLGYSKEGVKVFKESFLKDIGKLCFICKS